MKENKFLISIQEKIAPLRANITNHLVYKNIKDINDVSDFMQYHVFAVWDFMSLLKFLQKELTCTSVPWFPVGDPDLRFLINEIVTGEESDVDKNGRRMSHFEMYKNAMLRIGANTNGIDTFLENLKEGESLEKAFKLAKVPVAAQKMVRSTFEAIATGKLHIVAAVFTFGREDLIPDMFHGIIKGMTKKYPNELSDFMYYLERHIEVDGDHHSELALKMIQILCGDDPIKWEEAEEAVIAVLHARSELWNGVLEKMEELT